MGAEFVEGLGADAGDAAEVVDLAERAVFVAVVDDAFGERFADPLELHPFDPVGLVDIDHVGSSSLRQAIQGNRGLSPIGHPAPVNEQQSGVDHQEESEC